MQKFCSIACFCLGTIFFVVALLGLWRHFITMGVCFSVGVLVKEDDPEE